MLALLPTLLKSRRFQTALIGLVMIVVVHFFPDLESRQTEITEAILVIIGLIVGGYTADHLSYNLGVGKSKANAEATIAITQAQTAAQLATIESAAQVEIAPPQVWDPATERFRDITEGHVVFDDPDLA